jgi:dTDP-4-amino-4,6-dideoxygalactose transaminase
MKIPFNRPYFTGNEIEIMIKAAMAGQLSGNGTYTRKCHRILEKRFGFGKAFLTTSCTDALEMSALLTGIVPGDEVIVPSFTFVSTANAFVLRGAKIVFADSSSDNPNIDVDKIEELITPRTKAIVVVHYAGVACEMDTVMELAKKYNLVVIEDAAHSIDSYYKKKALGSIGHFGAFSYHETKNLIAGEGGALAVNDERFVGRAEIVWEKGTNRVAFKRGEVKKYEWVDIGSSYLPSEVTSSILYAQLMEMKKIQKQRKNIWYQYHERLSGLEKQGYIRLPALPSYATNNGHMYYLLASQREERDKLLKHLNRKGIQAVFHYLPLHDSPFYQDKHDGRELPMAGHYAGCILRLPFYFELREEQIDEVVSGIRKFYGKS